MELILKACARVMAATELALVAISCTATARAYEPNQCAPRLRRYAGVEGQFKLRCEGHAMATKKKRVGALIGEAVGNARRDVKTLTARTERSLRRQVKKAATRVKNAAIKLEKAAVKLEKAASPRKPAKAPTPGQHLDKGIAKVRRAGRKAGSAIREAVATPTKPARRAPRRRTA